MIPVFISHPYSGEHDRNTKQVSVLARRLVFEGYLPLTPQLFLPKFIDEATERDLALQLCLGMVALADELWHFGEPTEGMQLEIAEACRLGIPVVDGAERLKENRPESGCPGAVMEEGTT